jgi:hypothetical protein
MGRLGRPRIVGGTKNRSMRWPMDIYPALTKSARENERSFTQEVVFRLRQQMKAGGEQPKRA